MTPLRINITRDGRIHFIYTDTLQPLCALGTTAIRRASHVEPTTDGHWVADLSPSRGPVLGPFTTRAEALTAEIHWLLEHWIRPVSPAVQFLQREWSRMQSRTPRSTSRVVDTQRGTGRDVDL